MDGLRFVLYDKAGKFKREFSGVQAAADLLPNAISTATFTLDDDDPALPAVTAPGARCAVWFRGAERFRGVIQETPFEGPEGVLTAHVRADIRKLWHWQGWQLPTAAVGAQSQAYRTYTGPAETVFKNALRENFTRLGVPWTVAPDQGRGLPTRAEFRMHPLADKLMPPLIENDLITTLAYEGGGVVVDLRESKLVPGVLTVATGIPDSYSGNRIAPTVTRVVVGGRGEGVAREFVQVIDPVREAEWGDIIEGFVDARNTDEGSDISIDGREALAEGAPRAAIATTLAETARFQYGKTYIEGDRVRVRVGPVDTTQQISVAVTEDADEGVVITPSIGELDVSADMDVQLANQVARLARGIRDRGRR